MSGYVVITTSDGYPITLALDAIESVRSVAGMLLGQDYAGAKSYVRTRSGDSIYVRDEYSPLALRLLLDRPEATPCP